MKAYIEYCTTKDGVDYSKWVPSIHYDDICKHLQTLMKGGRQKVFSLGTPFILTLVAGFESNLNDWLVIDTFEKHGPANYEALVSGYVLVGPKQKYRLAVSVMTDNAFQVRENSSLVKDLDELIDVRNQLVHPKPRFYYRISKHKVKPKRQRAEDHPLFYLKLGDCKRYLRAVKAFDRMFFSQYDRGTIKENNLLKEITRILRETK
jgi:hypothetical protein